MPALAGALHPVVDTSAGTQWGHRLSVACGAHRAAWGIAARPAHAVHRSHPRGEGSVPWAQLPAAAAAW